MSDEPFREKTAASVVQHNFSSGPSNAFKFAELIKNPNNSLNDSNS
jgi:hypothetical protein